MEFRRHRLSAATCWLIVRQAEHVIHGTERCRHRVEVLHSIVCEGFGDLFCGGHARQRMAVAHRFAHGHYVRREVLPLLLESPEVTPRTAKARLHLIGDKDATG